MSERLSQELVKLATLHRHTMTVSDLMDAAAIVAERDQLRAELGKLQSKLSAAEDAEDAKNGAINNLTAELAAAKAEMQEGENDCRFCRDSEGDSKYPCTCGWTYGALALAYGNAIQDRDALRAELAAAKMLAEAVEAGREAVELARLESARLDCVLKFMNDQRQFWLFLYLHKTKLQTTRGDADLDEWRKWIDAAIDAAMKEAK